MNSYDDIYVDLANFEVQDVYPLVHILEEFRSYEMGPLEDDNNMSTVIGPGYFLNFYESFRNLVNGYLDFLIRDLCSIADMASSLVEYDYQCADGIVGVGYMIANEFNRDVYNPATLTLPSFSVDSNMVLSDTWEFYKSEMDEQIATIESNLVVLLAFIPNLKIRINNLSATRNFTGAAATAAKDYFRTIHLFACDSLYVCAQNAYAWIAQYWIPYRSSRIFEAGEDGTCVIIKPELMDLVEHLEAKKSEIEELYPGIAEHNSTLAADTNNEYDYANSLTCLYSLPENIDSLIASCTNLVECVEEYEPYVLSYIAPQLESVCQEFYEFVSQLTGLTRDDFIAPPADINAVYHLDEYSVYFAEVQARNEVNMTGVMSEAIDETNEINEELSIEARLEQRGYEIASSMITIFVAIVSIIATAGTDAPGAVVVIGSEVGDIIFCCADIYENADEIEMLRNGDRDPEGFNPVRDTILCFIDDPDVRQNVYVVVRICVGSASGISEGELGEVAIDSVSEVSLLSTGGDDNLVELVMIPVELTNGGGISADFEGALNGFETIGGASCNIGALSVNDNYDEWLESYNAVQSTGLVGGAGFVV